MVLLTSDNLLSTKTMQLNGIISTSPIHLMIKNLSVKFNLIQGSHKE